MPGLKRAQIRPQGNGNESFSGLVVGFPTTERLHQQQQRTAAGKDNRRSSAGPESHGRLPRRHEATL
jgi:hypothetical protein